MTRALTEELLIDIKTKADLKAIADLIQSFNMMKRQGIDVSDGMGRVDKYLGKMNLTTDQLNRSFGRFKFELLGVMFFGMQMERTFGAMLEPARKMVDVQDTWSTLLGARFINVAIDELNWALAMNSALDEMSRLTGGVSDATLGYGIKIGEVSGSMMMWTGQIGLAINSLEKLGLTMTEVKGLALTGLKIGVIIGAMIVLNEAIETVIESLGIVQKKLSSKEIRPYGTAEIPYKIPEDYYVPKPGEPGVSKKKTGKEIIEEALGSWVTKAPSDTYVRGLKSGETIAWVGQAFELKLDINSNTIITPTSYADRKTVTDVICSSRS